MEEKVKNDKLSILNTFRSEGGFTFNESLKKWNELKKVKGNSYIYQTRFNSWDGFGTTTRLRVENGIVTMRIYLEYEINGFESKRENK